ADAWASYDCKARSTTVRGSEAMIRAFLVAMTIAPLLVGAVDAQICSGCGCRGGPGYRGPDGNCVGWKALDRICGRPPTTRCTPELVNSDKPTTPKGPLPVAPGPSMHTPERYY